MLYADAGDNVQTFTQGGNTYRVSQTLSDLLGKQLRINVAAFNSGVATRDDTTVGHLIPADNPFVGTATGINQLIYALGLRNPFTFAVQPGTGTIFINDVGENTWEEIDQSVAGANFGWSGGNTDGFGQSPPGPGVYHDPLLAYNHVGGPAGGGTAIVGGTFYDPATPQFPSNYIGKYFYADLSGGWIRVFDPADPGSASNPDTSTSFATGIPGGQVDLTVDSAGNLYDLSQNGTVTRISYQAPQVASVAPTITAEPTGQQVNAGQTATFTVVASGSAPLTYQWQHLVATAWANVGTDSPTYAIGSAMTADAGSYRVIVSNGAGSATSETALLVVNPPPCLHRSDATPTPAPSAALSPGLKAEFFDFTTRLKRLPNLGGRVADGDPDRRAHRLSPDQQPLARPRRPFRRHLRIEAHGLPGGRHRRPLYTLPQFERRLEAVARRQAADQQRRPASDAPAVPDRRAVRGSPRAACRLLREYRESRADRLLGRAGDREAGHPRRQPVPGLCGGLNFDRPFVERRIPSGISLGVGARNASPPGSPTSPARWPRVSTRSPRTTRRGSSATARTPPAVARTTPPVRRACGRYGRRPGRVQTTR